MLLFRKLIIIVRSEMFLKSFRPIFFGLITVHLRWIAVKNSIHSARCWSVVGSQGKLDKQGKRKLDEGKAVLFNTFISPGIILKSDLTSSHSNEDPDIIESLVCGDKILNKAYNLYDILYCIFCLFCFVRWKHKSKDCFSPSWGSATCIM